MSVLSLSKIVWLALVVNCAHARTDDDQDRPTLRGTNTSNSGPSFGQNSPFSNLNNNAGSGFRQGTFPFSSAGQQLGLDSSVANGFQQQGGGLRQQQLLQQQFDSNPFQAGLGGFPGGAGQQNLLLRPDLALLQQQQSLRQSNFGSSPFANPLLNQAGLGSSSGQFGSLGGQADVLNQLGGIRNPSTLQQQTLGSNSFQNQLGLQSNAGFQGGQFTGQFDQQNPLLLSLLQQNSFGTQSQLGNRPQLSSGILESQRQLAMQQNLLNQLGLAQQNPLQQLQLQGLSNDQSVFPFNRPNKLNSLNAGSLGSSSLDSPNQILLQGGRFQDPTSSLLSGRPFINSNRLPFQSNGFPGNGFFIDGNNNFGSQLSGSQFDWTVNRNKRPSAFRPGSQNEFRPANDGFSEDDRFSRPSSPLVGPQNSFAPQGVFGFNNFSPGFGDSFLQTSPSSTSKSQSIGGFWNEIDRNADIPLRSQMERDRLRTSLLFNNAGSGTKLTGSSAQEFPDSLTLGTRVGAPTRGNPFLNPIKDPNSAFGNKSVDSKIQDIPETGFSCNGRVPGHYADVSTGCRVFHMCHLDGSKSTFVCGNGTVFDQVHTVCQWAEEVDCSKSQIFYPQSSKPMFTTPAPIQTQIPLPNVTISPTQSTPTLTNNQGIPPSIPGLMVGQPNIAMGSLDAGRSMKDATDRNLRPFGLFAPPHIRPALIKRRGALQSEINSSDFQH